MPKYDFSPTKLEKANFAPHCLENAFEDKEGKIDAEKYGTRIRTMAER